MALDEREYVNERYKLPDKIKEARIEELRQRFEAATPKQTRRFEIPLPQSNGAIAVMAIIFGCAMAAIVIGIVKLTASP